MEVGRDLHGNDNYRHGGCLVLPPRPLPLLPGSMVSLLQPTLDLARAMLGVTKLLERALGSHHMCSGQYMLSLSVYIFFFFKKGFANPVSICSSHPGNLRNSLPEK